MHWFIHIILIGLWFSGCTTLHTAAKKGNIKAIDRLIEDGEPLNMSDDEGMTPLTYAIAYNQKESFDALVKAGADLNLKDPLNGNTPLHEAVISGNRYFITQLLSKGADPYVKNKNGLDPIMIASKKNSSDIQAIFTDYHTQQQSAKRPDVDLVIKEAKIQPPLVEHDEKTELQSEKVSVQILPKSEENNVLKNELPKTIIPADAFSVLERMIERRETMGIRNYLDQYPDALESIKEVRQKVRYVGPSGMRIIDILEKKRNQKMGDTEFIKIITSDAKPYKKFTSEERDILGKYGLSKPLLDAMEKVTIKEEKNVN